MANEKRLIDANAIIAEHCNGCSAEIQAMCKTDPVCGSMMWIVEAPTVDAVEVVHARWHKPTPYSQEFCTNCRLMPKTNFGWLPPYCPNCGAIMDGDGNG